MKNQNENQVPEIPKFLDDAWENMDYLLSGMTQTQRNKIGFDTENGILFTSLGMLVKLKNAEQMDKPFDVLIMDSSNKRDIQVRIIQMAKKLLETDPTLSNINFRIPVEDNHCKDPNLVNARKIIDVMSNSQRKYEISQAMKKGLSLEQHIAEKKLISIK